VGPHIVDDLFRGQDNVLGEQVRVERKVYTIIGQFDYTSARIPGAPKRFDYEARENFIPATTAMVRFMGSDKVSDIELLAFDVETMPDLIEQVENTLIQTHRGIQDFEIRTQDKQIEELAKLEDSFTYSLGGIAGISLLVGGIGIMNVMLASVSERIREIGVRKAIGARSHDIFIQFLAEAVVISILGGLLGLAASVGLLSLAREMIPEGEGISNMPMTAMTAGFIFSSLIGLASGVYPALRASRLDPIDALRYE
jgi:ABC-type antimicrobial peptide transport system permease subunit